MKKDYNQLRQFFGAYFHQDWDIDGEIWEEVITTYLATNSCDERILLTSQLDAFIEEIKAKKIDGETLLSDFGCDYNFDADGMSALEWISLIRTALNDEVSS